MKFLRKSLTAMMVITIIFIMIFSYNSKEVNSVTEAPIKVGVLLYKSDDAYISLVQKSLEEIQKKNENKVEFTFYDGKNDQSIQNQTIETLLQNKSVDLFLLNLVDFKNGYKIIHRIKENNIPVVLFNREPLNMDSVKSYNKAFFVGTDASQAGELQGKILIDEWNKNQAAMDINGDNKLQYIMLVGEIDNKEAINRTKYSISTINDAGIQTKELESIVGNWDREITKTKFQPLFMRYGINIEAIISNNDEMAIGAIEVLQKYGFNKGDNTKKIAVIGVDATPEAQKLIIKGEMTGTVLQDAPAMAEACYVIGMNLINNKNPLDGTKYKLDETEVAIRIPYKNYIG